MQIRQELIHHCLRYTGASVFSNTDNETSLCMNAAKNLRLVNSTWRKEINQTFLRSKIPLLAFRIFQPTSSIHDAHPRHESIRSFETVKYLDFLMSFLDGPLEQTPPPFSLDFIIHEPLRYPIHIWHLQNFFSKNWLISSLVKLTINDNEPFNTSVR